MSAQMALLGGGKWSSVADLEEPSVSTAPVTCKGKPGQLRIAAGTGVSFSVYEVRHGLLIGGGVPIAKRQLVKRPRL